MKKKRISELIQKLNYCPSVFDYVNEKLRPGFILLCKNDLFRDDEDDP